MLPAARRPWNSAAPSMGRIVSLVYGPRPLSLLEAEAKSLWTL